MTKDFTSQKGTANIKAKYRFAANLGCGGYGTVYKGILKSNTKIVHAIKAIRKNKVENEESFRTEVSIAQKLDHPNIVKIYELYEDNIYFFIVMEFCEGGELLHYIADNDYLREDVARHFFS